MTTSRASEFYRQVNISLVSSDYGTLVQLLHGHLKEFQAIITARPRPHKPEKEEVFKKLDQIVSPHDEEVTDEYVKLVILLIPIVKLSVLEVHRLIESVKKSYPDMSVKILWRYAMKKHFDDREMILDGFLRVLLHFNYFPVEIQGLMEKTVIKKLLDHEAGDPSKRIIRRIIQAIQANQSHFFTFPKFKYLLYEMSKLNKIMYFLTTSQFIEAVDSVTIIMYHKLLCSWLNSLNEKVGPRVKTELLKKYDSILKEMCVVCTLSWLNVLDTTTGRFKEGKKRKRNFNSLLEDDKFILSVTTLLTKHEAHYNVDGNTYLNGMYGLLCLSWSIFMKEKYIRTVDSIPQANIMGEQLYHQQQEEHQSKSSPQFQYRKISKLNFEKAQKHLAFKCLAGSLKNSDILFENGNPERNFYLNSIFTMLVAFMKDKGTQINLSEDNLMAHKLLRDEEEYIKKTLYRRINRRTSLYSENDDMDEMTQFRDFMKCTKRLFSKEPKFGRHLFGSDPEYSGIANFLLKRCPLFVSDTCKLTRSIHGSFSQYLGLLTALCKDEQNSLKIHRKLSEKPSMQPLLTWAHFVSMIKTLEENSKSYTGVSDCSEFYSIFQLMQSSCNSSEEVRRFLLNVKEIKIIPLLVGLCCVDINSKLVGYILKTLAALVNGSVSVEEEDKMAGYKTGILVWKNLEKIEIITKGGFEHQLEKVQRVTQEYYELIGTLTVIEKLTRLGIPTNMNNSFYPYYWYLDRRVLLEIGGFGFKNKKQKWVILTLVFKIFINLIKDYVPRGEHFIAHWTEESAFSVSSDVTKFYTYLKTKDYPNCSFEILQRTLTLTGNILFKLKEIFEIEKPLELYSEQHEALLEFFRFLDLVQSKEEEFRFEGLKNQRTIPLQFHNVSEIVDHTFITGFISKMQKSPNFLVKYYSLKIFKRIAASQPNIFDLFVSQSTHYKLMNYFMEGITQTQIQTVILDILISNTKLAYFCCGLREHSMYQYKNRDKNVLQVLFTNLDFSKTTEKNEMFIIKSLEFITKLCENAQSYNCKDEILNVLERETFFDKLISVIKLKNNKSKTTSESEEEEEEENENYNEEKIMKESQSYLRKLSYILKIISWKIYQADSGSHVRDLINRFFKNEEVLGFIPVEVKNKTAQFRKKFSQKRNLVVSLLEEIIRYKRCLKKINLPRELQFIDKKFIGLNTSGIREYDLYSIHKHLTEKKCRQELIQRALRLVVMLNHQNRLIHFIKEYYVSLTQFIMVILSSKFANLKLLSTQQLYELISISLLNLNKTNLSVNTGGIIEFEFCRVVNFCFSKLLEYSKNTHQVMEQNENEEEDNSYLIEQVRIPKNLCFQILTSLISSLHVVKQRSRSLLYNVVMNYLKYTSTYVERTDFQQVFDQKTFSLVATDSMTGTKNCKILALSCCSFVLDFLDFNLLDEVTDSDQFLKFLDGLSSSDEANNSPKYLVILLNFFVKLYNKNMANLNLTTKLIYLLKTKYSKILQKRINSTKKQLYQIVEFNMLFISLNKLIASILSNYIKNERINNSNTVLFSELQNFYDLSLKEREYSPQAVETFGLVVHVLFLLTHNERNIDFISKNFDDQIHEKFAWYLKIIAKIDEESRNEDEKEGKYFQIENDIRRVLEVNVISLYTKILPQELKTKLYEPKIKTNKERIVVLMRILKNRRSRRM